MDSEIPVTAARAQFSELVNRVGYGKERIVLTRHGRPLVALVPAELLAEADAGDEDDDDGAVAEVVLDLSARSEVAAPPQGIAARTDRTLRG